MAVEVEELYRGLAERIGDRVEALDPRAAAGIAHGISPSPELLSALAAPVGVVLRERNVVLKTNLSTRPFYNERAVHWALAVAFAAIVALTVFNVTRVMSLSARQGTLSAEVQREEARIQQLTAQADESARRASTRKPSRAS